MVTLPQPAQTFVAVNSLDQPLRIAEQLPLRVLEHDSERVVSAVTIKLVGRRLIFRVSEYLAPDTCVRIDCEDAFLLGETLGSWREGTATFAAVEIRQALTGLSELAQQERSWDYTETTRPHRQIA